MHHAGNSSGIVDGAALMLVGSKEGGAKAGLKPRARIRAAAVIGSEPTIMLTGPTPACRKALAKAGMAASDIDLFEINEAFAVVPMKTARDLGVDLDRVNVNGGVHRDGPPAGRHRLHHPRHPARRAGAPQPVHRPGHAVRGRRHGHRHHHRAGLTMSAVTLNLGDDGLLVATMDLPGRTMNVVGDVLMAGLAEAAERLATDPAVKGLILASAKADFCAGGDLDNMFTWTRPEQPFEASMAMKKVLRRLETTGKPVVAALNGHTLGGGLEIALACHARIALDDPRLKIGQPEVKLGLLPGGGGTQRLPRLLGMQPALQIMAEGNDLTPQKALAWAWWPAWRRTATT